MSADWLTERVDLSEVEGRRVSTRWLDGGKKACNGFKDAKVVCMDRERWREFVKGTNGGVNL